MAMFCALSWLRLVYSLRGETWIGPRLLPILSAIKDTFAFFFLMTICIVAASHAYYNLELRNLEIENEAWPTYAAFMQVFRLGIFGDFDMFEFEGLDQTYTWQDADNASVLEPQDPDPGPHYAWVHALFYITGVGITVLLMNVLISVLSENYSKYAAKEKAIGQFFRARVKILVDVQNQPERLAWNCLQWACQKRKTKDRRQNAQSIAQCPQGGPQTSAEQTQCDESENRAAQKKEGSTQNRLLRIFCCFQNVALVALPLPLVIWFLFDFFGLNINCLICQLRYACGYFGYAPLRDEPPDQEGNAKNRTTKQKMEKDIEKHQRERRRAAAKDCAIFFVVRDQPDLNDIQSLGVELKKQIESLDARMQTVEKQVQGMDNKMETLEHKLGGQIETGFKQMRELVGQTRRRRSSRSEHVPPFEMQAADDG